MSILGAYFCAVFLAMEGGALAAAMGNESEESGTPIETGGPCAYKQYPGKTTIVSIHKKRISENNGGSAYQRYEVKFIFSTDAQIEETHGQVKGRTFSLRLTNSWYPGPKFLEKYGIEEGQVFDCYLNVLIKGTCTPVFFSFPGIDLSDYFETRKREKDG